MDRKKRLLYQLDTPFSTVSWPQVVLEDQDTILELLCTLLAPLGQYRTQNVTASKGRRDKKRKRKESTTTSSQLPIPPAPELRSYVDVGLSTVTRRLQEATAARDCAEAPSEERPTKEDSPHCFYSVIFVARSGQPNVLNSHLPQMVAAASKAHPQQVPIRLVGLSKACEEHLSESLGIPRVSCIGLHENAPNSKPLVEFAREHVPVIKMQWLDEAGQAEHRQTKINAIETTIGAKKQTART
ncbi:hypothetical protein DL769_009365 [Monosporascus sp. CRB-8-3]|nr:hypothetical protein DL769_009365 [Monosporascus sp. CRB-8-3]